MVVSTSIYLVCHLTLLFTIFQYLLFSSHYSWKITALLSPPKKIKNDDTQTSTF